MKYRIIRLLYYYKYDSKKAYFGISFFLFQGKGAVLGRQSFSEEARVALKNFKVTLRQPGFKSLLCTV